MAEKHVPEMATTAMMTTTGGQIQQDQKRLKILVTGYGPFGCFQVNPSAVVVSRLKEDGGFPNREGDRFELCFDCLAVDYEQALRCSKRAWNELQVDFSLHIGVHNEKCFKIESTSYSHGYTTRDVAGYAPDRNRCELLSDSLSCEEEDASENAVDDEKEAEEKPEKKRRLDGTLKTCLDCTKLAADVQSATDILEKEHKKVDIRVSNNPGRYLCAYIYYCSLHLSAGRSLFLHVPPLDDELFTAELQVEVVKAVIRALSLQLLASDDQQQ